MLTEPAQNWYRQLAIRTIKTIPDAVLRFGRTSFPPVIPFKKRPDEYPLDYLYRWNVIGLRAKLKIENGPPKIQKDMTCRALYENLDDPELADQLTMPDCCRRIGEVLRVRQLTNTRQSKT